MLRWIAAPGIFACAIGVVAWSSARAQGPYIIGPNVQVSRAQSTIPYMETQIAADPVRAGHLITCAIAGPLDSTENVFYVSFNNGKTWVPTLTVRPGVDPSCAIDRHGVAYAGTIHDSLQAGVLNIQRSVDGGRTWATSAVRVATRSIDRSYLTVEDGREAERERVYVHAYMSAPRDETGKKVAPYATLYTSSDGGRTVDHVLPIPATAFPRDPWYFPANGAVAADESFIALIVELDHGGQNMFAGRSDSASAPHAVNGALLLIRSTDGGKSAAISRTSDAFYDSRVPQLSMSTLAVDRSKGPYHGRLYVAWPDARSERRTQIHFSSSDDVGRSWSAPRIVSDDAASLRTGDRPNNFMPMVAVNNKGVVGLSWYDRRDSPNNLTYTPRFAASLDGGATWLPSVAVSTSSAALLPTDPVVNGGDTSGLAADAEGVFHVCWIDNRTGIRQVWTATVRVQGTVLRRTG